MKKLDKIYKEIVEDDVNVYNELSSLSASIKSFMKKFGIGYNVKTFKQESGAITKLRSTLQKILMTGKDVSSRSLENQIKDKVLKKETGLSDYEIERVARTEAKSMNVATKLMYWKEMGIKKVRWRTNINSNSGDYDISMNNKIIDIDEAIKNPDLRPPAHPNCFINPKTPIFSSKGWKNIKDIKVNDLVLTHKGKFEKVNKIMNHDLYKGEVCELVFSYKFNQNKEKFIKIKVTPEHPILTNNGWILAKNLKQFDKIIFLGEKCECGNIYPVWFNGYKHCCDSCHSKYNALRQWDNQKSNSEFMKKFSSNISKKMIKQYNNGVRDKFKTTLQARNSIKQKLKTKGYLIPKENRLYGNKNVMNNAIVKEKHKQACIKRGRGYETLIYEDMFENILKQLNENYVRNQKFVIEEAVGFPPKPEHAYRVDFCLEQYKLIIEIDGVMKNKDYDIERQKFIEQKGYSFLRIFNDQVVILKNIIENNDISKSNIFEFLKESNLIAQNHRGQYHFVVLELFKNNLFKLKRACRLYNFSVNKYHSYIANGVCVHNCRCRFVVEE